jgi:hypothetical protein
MNSLNRHSSFLTVTLGADDDFAACASRSACRDGHVEETTCIEYELVSFSLDLQSVDVVLFTT